MATIYVHPGFLRSLHKPTKATTGLITSIYYVGTWLSYLFVSHPLADRFGRRVAAATGVFVTGIGAAVQTGANAESGLAMMIVGRIICGFGLAIVSTSVPLYQRWGCVLSYGDANLAVVKFRPQSIEGVMW
jgi:MFS family permease